MTVFGLVLNYRLLAGLRIAFGVAKTGGCQEFKVCRGMVRRRSMCSIIGPRAKSNASITGPGLLFVFDVFDVNGLILRTYRATLRPINNGPSATHDKLSSTINFFLFDFLPIVVYLNGKVF